MKIEYEVRVLEIDKEEFIKKIEALGAKKIGDFEQKRYVYDLVPYKSDCEWIRLRTNGKKATLAYKNVEVKTIDGTKELEIEVSDFEVTRELLEKMGYEHRNYQENRRTQYILDDVEIDIDSWPLIPTYVELEGKSKEAVEDIIEKLELDKTKITALDVQSVYHEYGIDINKIKNLKF